jgi:hypothetical protein
MQTTLTSPTEWAQQEFGIADLGDIRRNRRLVKVASELSKESRGTLPGTFSNWAQLKAAYRLLENPSVSYRQIIEPHWVRTRDDCRQRGDYLHVEDTTALDFTGRAAEDMGMIGDGRGRGVLVHSTLSLRIDHWSGNQEPQVTAVGLLGQQCWRRPPAGTNRRRKRGDPCESDRWAAVFKQTGPSPDGSRWTFVADRESDMYESFERCQAAKVDFIIRAAQQRALVGENQYLFDAVAQPPALGSFTLKLRAREGQRARDAIIEIRVLPVMLRGPKRPGGKRPDCAVTVVEAREVQAPAGAMPIHWILLSSWDCNTLDQALRVIKAYACRWLIEEYHKALKSGVHVENSQLETAQRIESLLGVLAVLAVRLLNAKLLAVTCPDQPVDRQEFGPEAMAILESQAGKPHEGWTCRSVVRAIARLGGFIGRKSDGNPGWQTIWRGFQKLMTLVAGYDLARSERCG